MLTQESIVEGQALAGAIPAHIALNPYPNTFLDTMVTLTKNELDMEMVGRPADHRAGSSLYDGRDLADRLKSLNQITPHTALVDGEVASAIKIVQRNISLARTDAVPLICSVLDDLKQVINPDIPYAYQRMEVFPLSFHPVWDTEYVVSQARDFKRALPLKDVPAGIIRSVEEEQYTNLLQLTTTGLTQIDALLGKVVQGYETQELLDLFRRVFHDGQRVSFIPESTYSSLNDLVIVHVWAQKVLDMMPERSDLTRDQYREAVSNIIAHSGIQLSRALEARAAWKSMGRVVLDYAGNDRVIVNADTYQDFLKAGGTPEVVMGAAISGMRPKPVNQADLLAQGAAFIKGWNQHVTITSRRDQESLMSAARSELFRIVRRRIEERAAQNLVDSVEGALERLNAALLLIDPRFARAPAVPVRNLICQVFYPGGDVGLYLEAIDRQAEADEHLSEDEAATLALFDYLSSWISKFIVRGRSGL